MDGDYYRRWANSIGSYAYQVIDCILTSVSFEEQAYKSCMGLLQLSKKHGNEALEAACCKALDLNSITYTTVKNILSNGQQSTPMTKPGKALPTHSNLRSGSWS
jgi:hypothetical protein